MSLSISQIFAKLNILNAEVALCRNTYQFTNDDERWACSFTLNNDGTELKIRAYGTDGDQALIKAFAKLDALLNASQVVSALNLPLLASPANA